MGIRREGFKFGLEVFQDYPIYLLAEGSSSITDLCAKFPPFSFFGGVGELLDPGGFFYGLFMGAFLENICAPFLEVAFEDPPGSLFGARNNPGLRRGNSPFAPSGGLARKGRSFS